MEISVLVRVSSVPVDNFFQLVGLFRAMLWEDILRQDRQDKTNIKGFTTGMAVL